MFTGIIEALGYVESIEHPSDGGRRLRIRTPPGLFEDASVGASVAVSGVCLTVVEVTAKGMAFDLAEETLRVTTLGDLAPEDPVNLERPLCLGGRLGGHLVLGHVDGVGEVAHVEPQANGRRLHVSVARALRRLLIPKGSVAVDGVSLTVATMEDTGFSVALIPHTLAVTTLGIREAGARVNLEMDVIGKYVQALLPGGDEAGAFLAQHGLREPIEELSRGA